MHNLFVSVLPAKFLSAKHCTQLKDTNWSENVENIQMCVCVCVCVCVYARACTHVHVCKVQCKTRNKMVKNKKRPTTENPRQSDIDTWKTLMEDTKGSAAWLIAMVTTNLYVGVPPVGEVSIRERVVKAEVGKTLRRVVIQGHVVKQVDLTVREARLHTLLQQLNDILKASVPTDQKIHPVL